MRIHQTNDGWLAQYLPRRQHIWKSYPSHSDRQLTNDATYRAARELLIAHLTEDELEDYNQYGLFVVQGLDTVYMIVEEWGANVLDMGDKVWMCIRLVDEDDYALIPDRLLMQKLMIQCAEAAFRDTVRLM